jgi:hypothetical protein
LKRTALLVVLLAIVASLFALPASANAAGPTKAQFQSLKRQVSALQSQVRALQTGMSCFVGFPVTSWGDPAASTGYLWGDAAGSMYVTTAMDFVPDTSGMTEGPDYVYMTAFDPNCTSGYARTTQSLGGASPEAPRAPVAVHASKAWGLG